MKKEDKGLTYDEFMKWAVEYMIEGLITKGFSGLRSNFHAVVQAQHVQYVRHGGFATGYIGRGV